MTRHIQRERRAADPRAGFAAESIVDLADAHVAILGAGSVGAWAAWGLASRGVGRLELADKDRLAPENLRRHACGRADLGRAKSDGVADLLRDHFPSVSVHPSAFCFLEQPHRLRDVVARAEIVVVAVDDEGPKFLIDAMARELGRAAVYLGVYGGGWAAEAILVDSARGSPCYACTVPHLGRVGIALTPPATAMPYALPMHTADHRSWHQADLGSILPTAALGQRLVAAWLESRRGEQRPLREFQGKGRRATAWRLAIRRVPAWGIGPWQLERIPIRRQSRCHVCGRNRDAYSPDHLEALLEDSFDDGSDER